MNRSSVILAAILACVAILVGCSGGGGPVTPASTPEITPDRPLNTESPNTHLWGYFDVFIDIENQNAEAVVNRNVMFSANVVTFLNSNPAGLTFIINSTPIGPDYIDVDIDVALTHPFPGMPMYNGYDVRGVFMGDGSLTMDYNGDLIYPALGTDQFMFADPVDSNGGPDGYTRWFNLPEFSGPGMPLFLYTQGNMASPGFAGTSTLNPYRYFADGLGTNDNLMTWLIDHSDQNGQFSSGATNDRNYYLRFPNDKGTTYGYAVIANWEGTEEEFHPSNTSEAVACDIDDNSDVWYVGPTENGGDLELDISVFDWGAELSAGAMEDYSIFIESTVLSSVYAMNVTEMTPVGGGEHYSTYSVEIPADNITQLENNEYWVIVECANYDYTNEFGMQNDAWADPLAAFFRIDLDVANQSPCGATLDHMNPDTAGVDDSLTDVEIIGDGFAGGPSLACYLTNGPININGQNVSVDDPLTVTADFNFGAAGATVGSYDLYFTNGDGCEVTLVDAFELVDVTWPVLVEAGTTYYCAKFIEDSNGIFHILCSSCATPPQSGNYPSVDIIWFISEDQGATWTNKGNIWTWPHTPNGTGPSSGHALAADGNGGVYAALPERLYPSTSGNDMFVAYLDTDSLGAPSTWTVNDWDNKQVVDGYIQNSYIAASPSGAILIIARFATRNIPYVYASSWSALPSTPGTVTRLNDYGRTTGITPNEIVQSTNNAIVYDPATGHFFFALGGLFDDGVGDSPWSACDHGGGLLLEYDPSGDSFSREEVIAYHFGTRAGLGGYNRFDKPYFGDVALDSDGYLHWVHQIQYPVSGPPFSLGNSQYTFGYATNASGSWNVDLPIKPSPTFYINPDPPDPSHPQFQREYERRGVNLVCNSSDMLIMSLESATNNKDFMLANDSGGAWGEPNIYQDHATGDHPVYQIPQGEAYGAYAAIAFTSQDTPNPSVNGSLYFTMVDGN